MFPIGEMFISRVYVVETISELLLLNQHGPTYRERMVKPQDKAVCMEMSAYMPGGP